MRNGWLRVMVLLRLLMTIIWTIVRDTDPKRECRSDGVREPPYPSAVTVKSMGRVFLVAEVGAPRLPLHAPFLRACKDVCCKCPHLLSDLLKNQVSRITLFDGLPVTEFDALPASASGRL